MPAEIADELALLQDRVPSFSFLEAKNIIESELECQLDSCFLSFDKEPIAAASIAQVHKAVLKDGHVVAVKIQRINLANTVKQDLVLLKFVIRLTKLIQPKGDWQNWSKLIDQFGRTLYTEMDFLVEGRNADRLRNILRPFPTIVIPRIFWQYTTKRLITEELCLGVRIDSAKLLKHVDSKRLAKCLLEAYLVQIVEHGYFHADPHAGNLAISTDGHLIMYDFGIMGYVTKKQRLSLANLISSIAKNNINLFVDALADLGFLTQDSQTDKNCVLKLIEPIWVRYHSPSANRMDLAKIEEEVDFSALSRYLELPANLAYLIRMIVALEAILRQLDPDLNFLRVARPYFQKITAS